LQQNDATQSQPISTNLGPDLLNMAN